MKLLEIIKKHMAFAAALVIVAVIIFVNISYFKPYMNKLQKRTDSLIDKSLNKNKSEDIEFDENGRAFLISEQARKKREKVLQSAPVTGQNEVTPPSVEESAAEEKEKITFSPPQVSPVVYNETRTHKNIFQPYYLNKVPRKESASQEIPQIEYKGFYFVDLKKIAIFRCESGLKYIAQGDLILKTDYIVDEIEARWVKIKNIRNSNVLMLSIGGGSL